MRGKRRTRPILARLRRSRPDSVSFFARTRSRSRARVISVRPPREFFARLCRSARRIRGLSVRHVRDVPLLTRLLVAFLNNAELRGRPIRTVSDLLCSENATLTRLLGGNRRSSDRVTSDAVPITYFLLHPFYLTTPSDRCAK